MTQPTNDPKELRKKIDSFLVFAKKQNIECKDDEDTIDKALIALQNFLQKNPASSSGEIVIFLIKYLSLHDPTINNKKESIAQENSKFSMLDNDEHQDIITNITKGFGKTTQPPKAKKKVIKRHLE